MKPIIITSALLVFGKRISMSQPKPLLIKAYLGFLKNPAAPAPAAPTAISHSQPHHNVITTEWTIQHQVGYEALEFQCPFNRDTIKLTHHLQTAL